MPYLKLQNLLHDALTSVPEKTAIRTKEQELSYRQLDDLIGQVAAGLSSQGIKPGDRVSWFLPNGMEAVLTTLACYRIGAVSVPLNYRYLAEEAAFVMNHIDASLLIFHEEHADVVTQMADMISEVPKFMVGDDRPGTDSFQTLMSNGSMDVSNVEADHPALILFTSGSTGKPKGVVHSHASAFHGIDISRQIFEMNTEDRVLVGKPISHAGGLETQLMPTLLARGEAYLVMKPTPAQAVSVIQERAITQYAMLASDLLDFIEYLEKHRTELPTLQNSIGSGDAIPTDLHQRFRDLFGWEVMEACGMTEIGGYYAANPRHGKRKWGSLGVTVPDTQLRIVDDHGVDSPAGEAGEILVQTPSATIGYWQNADATAELFRDGWLHTGDLGYRDDDDYIWFVGRKKLMIVRRGSNIAPAEIENVIDRHPAVHASVVVGIPDNRDGQVPLAWISLLPDERPPSEDELREFVASHLAAYKNPTQFLFLDELPRNSTGKFDRQKLSRLATQAIHEDRESK